MKSIIVAYPTRETAFKLKQVLEAEGLYVSHICGTGASVLGFAGDMRSGVVVCAGILRDMSAATIAERLPANFDVVALTRGGKTDYLGNLVSLPLPLDREDFLNTVSVLASSEASFTNRSLEDADYISAAKTILMRVNEMSEMQAHKFLQSESMRQCKKMAELARDIISEYS